MNRRILLTIIAMLVCLSCVPGLSVPAGIPCQLAANGKALAPIIVSPKANASVRHSAEQLRDMLQRITGAPFTVETGGGSTGLAVGLLGDFPTCRRTHGWRQRCATRGTT